MTITPDSLRSALAENARLGAAVDGASKRIGEGARARMDMVDHEIETLRSKVLTDPEAADRYQELIAERGQLNIVLGQEGA